MLKCRYCHGFTELLSECTFCRRNIIRRISMQSTGKIWRRLPLRTGKYWKAGSPNKALELVTEWIALHRNELLAIWETQEFQQLPPLE